MYKPVRANIEFRDSKYRTPVSYRLTGEDKEVIALADKLDDHLIGLRQWYTPLTRFSFVLAFGAIYVLVFVLGTLFLAANVLLPGVLYEELEPSGSDSRPGVTSAFVALFGLAIGLCWFLDWIRGKLFPVGIFAIGQGERYLKSLNLWRVVTLTGIILPILTGLLVNYLS